MTNAACGFEMHSTAPVASSGGVDWRGVATFQTTGDAMQAADMPWAVRWSHG